MPNFKITSGALAEAITSLMPIVPAKHNRDTLKNLKIVTSQQPDCIKIIASDLEVFAHINLIKTDSIELVVMGSTEFLVPATKFLEYIKSFTTNEIIEISDSLKPGLVTIFTESVNFEIGAQDLFEYPPFPAQPAESIKVKVPTIVFDKLISKSEFATADKNSSRVEFTCICIAVEENNIYMMATDAHRLSVVQYKLDTTYSEIKPLLVSPKALNQIVKMASGDDLTLIISENTLFITSENSCLTLQLINAVYPPVRDVIPEYDVKISLPRASFLSQLKRAAIATDNNQTIRFQLLSDLIVMSSQTREQNRAATVKFPCEYSGKELNIAINSEQLIQAFKVMESDDIDFYFREEDEKLLFLEENFNYVVMPQEI